MTRITISVKEESDGRSNVVVLCDKTDDATNSEIAMGILIRDTVQATVEFATQPGDKDTKAVIDDPSEELRNAIRKKYRMGPDLR